MLKRLLLILLLSSPLFAQYSSADFELARTTFERQFDHKLLEKYLTSNISANVKAALLSLGNAQDTSLVDLIMKPDYAKFGNYIAFALGEAGPSEKSEEYLLKYISLNITPEFQRANFEALGRCGSKNAFEDIVHRYKFQQPGNFNGISLAIAGFIQRGYKQQDGADITILMNELSDTKLPLKRRIDAAFAASRVDIPKSNKNLFIKVLFENAQGEDAVILKQYVLSCLRRNKLSPDSPEQIKSLINNNDWRLRTEAAKVIINHQFTNSEDLKSYLTLLADKNSNVSRQAAISLKDITIDSSLIFLLKDEISRKLKDNSLTSNTAGELFIAYCKFSPQELFTQIEKNKGRIKPGFIYRALGENLSSPSNNLSFLLKSNSTENNNDRLEILNSLIPLQKLIKENSQLNNYLLSNLKSNFAAAISITADGLDSVFIESHKEELSKIIIHQINLYQNNPDFVESNISLVNLAEKISPELKKDMLLTLKGSSIYPVQVFVCKELGVPLRAVKSTRNFYDLWTYSFKYSSARVTTEKGSFVIRLTPEYAPVSVGNFCKLAQSGFFNKVIFHRVVPDFVIQTGDPQGTGWGGPGYDIISEFSPIPFDKSYVGMASSGKDTEGSQWFVMHSNFPHLNGRYSNFGKVTEGMDVVDKIDQGDSIIKVELIPYTSQIR